ncbi:MAG: hypothetical protein WCC03_20190 [Candidatus Acidiferrales bacterium]
MRFITQTKIDVPQSGDFWSLYDTIADLVFTLRTARSFWSLAGYFGEARVLAKLNVTGLKLFYADGRPHGFGSLFYGSDEAISRSGITLSTQPREIGDAESDVTFASLAGDLSDTVTILANQLLRSLRHSVDLQKLRREVDQIVRGPGFNN